LFYLWVDVPARCLAGSVTIHRLKHLRGQGVTDRLTGSRASLHIVGRSVHDAISHASFPRGANNLPRDAEGAGRRFQGSGIAWRVNSAGSHCLARY
jgi:hypothetical protein